jgi:hypothetical protein
VLSLKLYASKRIRGEENKALERLNILIRSIEERTKSEAFGFIKSARNHVKEVFNSQETECEVVSMA